MSKERLLDVAELNRAERLYEPEPGLDFEKKVYGGEYNTKLPYGPTPEEKVAYKAEDTRLMNQFLADAQAYAIEQGVPDEYAAKVVHKAWEDGHAHGFTEILNCMYGLIEIFK
jgi:hypothetical protein